MIFKLELDGFCLFNLVIVFLIGIGIYIFLLLYLMVDYILQWIIFDGELYLMMIVLDVLFFFYDISIFYNNWLNDFEKEVMLLDCVWNINIYKGIFLFNILYQ